MMSKEKITVVCPVCGEHSFAAYDDRTQCPVCGWLNDAYQTEHKFVGHGTNYFSLAQQQKAWKILHLEDEVGYGTDNLLWGVQECKLCQGKIGLDECQYHFQRLMEGKLPQGESDLKAAQEKCAHCIMGMHKMLADPILAKTIATYADRDTYGNGSWGAGSDEYNLEYYQEELQSLVAYCQQEKEQQKAAPQAKRQKVNFQDAKDQLLAIRTADARSNYNLTSYFCRTLLSIADFIRYASAADGSLDHRFSLWAFGEEDGEDRYTFTEEEKQEAAKVLHTSLSYYNYRCEDMGLPGLYYLDNRYQGWEVEEFNDTIAAWFVDIGKELDEENIKLFIQETLQESFAYSHVKLALHLLAHLGYAKTDKKLQELVELYSRVPSLAELAKSCL